MNFVKRLVPKSLAGQLIGLILIALLGGHIVAFTILAEERRDALQAASRGEVLARTATIARLLSVSAPALHEDILKNAQTRFIRFSLSEQSATGHPPQSRRELYFAERLREMLDNPDTPVDVRLGFDQRFFEWMKLTHMHRNAPKDADDDEHVNDRKYAYHRDSKPWRQDVSWGIQLSVQFAPDLWLNSATQRPPRPASWAYQSLLALGLAILVIIGAVILLVRRITRPLATLAKAADALGRGETTQDIVEAGPQDLQRTIRAFNRMRHRLESFVEDRTNLLAAVSHDLRSPVTSLRLRAEFIEDPELREKIMETLIEMQTIIETTLIFAREETRAEETRATDLSALIESVVSDLKDLGEECTYEGPERFVLACRPISLKRAIRNLLENAITYGHSAKIKLFPGSPEIGNDHMILVEDDGPGIKEDEIERMFEPFVRFEASRNKETGGIGLGLAITRSIVRGHGGNIHAENKPEGGLRVIIHLPQAIVE